MFHSTTRFNQPLNDWKISSNTDVTEMFEKNKVMEQKNKPKRVIEVEEKARAEKEKKVAEMNAATRAAELANAKLTVNAAGQQQPKNKEELCKWINEYCQGYKYHGEPNDWDVTLITDMSHLFEAKTTFNEPLDRWDVSNVTDMKYMFYRAKSFNQRLNNWNINKVQLQDQKFMFYIVRFLIPIS